jgi:hypothetical protein
MTLDNTSAVVGTLVITLAFLMLGVERLRPQGLVPQGEQGCAAVLGQLLGGVWGPIVDLTPSPWWPLSLYERARDG